MVASCALVNSGPAHLARPISPSTDSRPLHTRGWGHSRSWQDLPVKAAAGMPQVEKNSLSLTNVSRHVWPLGHRFASSVQLVPSIEVEPRHAVEKN